MIISISCDNEIAYWDMKLSLTHIAKGHRKDINKIIVNIYP